MLAIYTEKTINGQSNKSCNVKIGKYTGQATFSFGKWDVFILKDEKVVFHTSSYVWTGIDAFVEFVKNYPEFMKGDNI